jgi:phosphoglycerate kinase
MASLADLYVNDAFGTAHRRDLLHRRVTHFLPGVAGFLLEKEIKYLGQVVAEPAQPFVAIMGGAKISDKIGVIKNLLSKADYVLIGGGMANTFFKAQGMAVADSLVEDEALETAKSLLKEAGTKLMLPVDVVLADKFDADAAMKTAKAGNVEDGWRILDIGPETVGRVWQGNRSSQHGGLERPHGRVRTATLCRRNIWRSQSGCRVQGCNRCRRWRFRSGHPAIGPG